MRNAYDKRFRELSKQKGTNISDKMEKFRELVFLNGAIYALNQVVSLGQRDESDERDNEKMTLTKEDVAYLHDQPCFSCRWSEVDPYDWGLRCCYDKSNYCTDYCPDEGCECLERVK
jgi:hypothetical protein